MLIKCQECNSKFQLEDTLLKMPKKVRCAVCGNIWIEYPLSQPVKSEALSPKNEAATSAKVPSLDEISVTKIGNDKSSKTQENSSKGLIISLKLLAVILLFAITLMALINLRSKLSDVPGLDKFYSLIGAYDTSNITIENFEIVKDQEYDQIFLSAKIINNNQEKKKFPILRLSASDANDHPIFYEAIKTSRIFINPQEVYELNFRLDNKYKNAKFLKLDVANKLDLILR